MELNEFIDTYSDDLIYLQEGRVALLTHPFRREMRCLCDASNCRMLSVMMIGSIETMLSEWRSKDKIGILDSWFSEKDKTGKKISNGEKVMVLCDAFHRAGIRVDEEVFNDFLAIKYLRNTVIHGRWRDHEKQFVRKRGFPTDTRDLSRVHWERMLTVNDNMMLYISLTGLAPRALPPDESSPVVRSTNRRLPEPTGIVKESDLPYIFWQNLERIGECIFPDVEQAAVTPQYYWAKDLSDEAIRGLSESDRMMLYYGAARTAGEKGLQILAQHRDLGEQALYSWREYKRAALNTASCSKKAMLEARETIRTLHDKQAYFKGPPLPWDAGMRAELASKLVESLLEGYEPLRPPQIAAALNLGNLVYEKVPNVAPAWVLNVLLPIVDPQNRKEYLFAGDDALTASELASLWRSFIDRTPPYVGALAFYRRFRDELRRAR